MKDRHGDPIVIRKYEGGDVGLWCEARSDQETVAAVLTPAKTRKLIRKLEAALDD